MLTNRRNENSHVLLPARTPAATRGLGIKTLSENVNSALHTQQSNAKQTLDTGAKKRTALAPKTPSAAAGSASLNALASKMGGLSVQPKKLFTNMPAKTKILPTKAVPKKSLLTAELIPTIKSHTPAARKPLVWDDMDTEYAPPKDMDSPELDFDLVDLDAVKTCMSTGVLGPFWSEEEEQAAVQAWREEDGKWREDLFEPEIIDMFPRSFSARSFKEFTPSLLPTAIPPTPPSHMRRTGTTPKLPLAPKLMSKEFSPRAPSVLYAELYGTRGSPVSRSLSRSSILNDDIDVNWTGF